MRYLVNAFCKSVLRKNSVCFLKRTYLSNAFSCDDVWERRLDGKIFQKVNCEMMFHELDSAYSRNNKLSAVDVDIFVNAQTNDSFINEVEEFIYKLRLTEETGKTLPTTHHAVIRLFLKFKKHEDLIRILNDRLNYGIFPDHYCSMLLMDYFIKIKDFRSAAKVGVLDMLQEDYSHEVVKYLSLYAIHKYLQTNQLWNDPVPSPAENDDDEDEKVRVSFLRNSYFDNHFDLIDGNHLCGKSLIMISSKLEGPMRDSYRLMGLALFNKWDEFERELKNHKTVKNEQPRLYVDALEFCRKFAENELADSEKLKTILVLLSEIDLQSCIHENLLSNVEAELNKQIEKIEKNEIQNQEKKYKEWEQIREERLAEYLAEMTKRSRLEEVERKKEELERREDLLYFFDNEEEIEKVVEMKRNKLKIRKQDIADSKEEDYVPPEVHKRTGRD